MYLLEVCKNLFSSQIKYKSDTNKKYELNSSTLIKEYVDFKMNSDSTGLHFKKSIHTVLIFIYNLTFSVIY